MHNCWPAPVKEALSIFFIFVNDLPPALSFWLLYLEVISVFYCVNILTVYKVLKQICNGDFIVIPQLLDDQLISLG